MTATFFSQLHDRLKEKNIVVNYQPQDEDKTDLEFLGIPFKKFKGDILEDIAYTATLAIRDKLVAFIIVAAIHPISDTHARYSKSNGMIMMEGAKGLLSAEIPYLTDDTQVPITWGIEERTTVSGQPYLALEGTCQMVIRGFDMLDEFAEFMEGWEDFPIVEFEEAKIS